MIGILFALLLPFLIWIFLISSHPSNTRYEMDWGVSFPGSFFSFYTLYHRLCSTLFLSGSTLSLIVAFVCRSEPSGILALAAVYALLVDIWMVYCYERYCHSKWPAGAATGYLGPSNYTTARYMLTLALGVSSLLLFVIGLIMAVAQIAGR